MRPAVTSPAATVVVVVLLLAAPVAFALQVRDGGVRPHRAVLAVAGPAVVAQALAERADALPGEAFDGRAVGSADSARDSVRDGTAEVAVVVDLERPRDTLLVSTTTAPGLVADYRSRLGAVSTGFGRELDVERVAPAAGDRADRRTPHRDVFVGVCIGVALAVLLSLWRGPVAASAARGSARLAALGLGAAVTAVVVVAATPGGASGARALVVALVVAVVSWLVLALESVLGLRGLAVASSALLGLAVPLLTHVETAALPAPWSAVLPWTPHGSALDLARGLAFYETSSARSWAVLVTWGLIAVITLLVARRYRPR